MKLTEHVETIRSLIDRALRNTLERMNITGYMDAFTGYADVPSASTMIAPSAPTGNLSTFSGDSDSSASSLHRARLTFILHTFKAETGTINEAFEKLVEELTFTLFNRIAAMKVMEAHTLHPEIITRRDAHGGRSFAHLAWIEQNPKAREEEAEGLLPFFEHQLSQLSRDIPLFSPSHPYHLLPTAIELLNIIAAFNRVETDDDVIRSLQIEHESLWRSDDILGWLYESYNNRKKAAHKAAKDKTEYNKVSIQSQVYTPRWVVKFLVDNSLGKLYLEMYPDSPIGFQYPIAGRPSTSCRERKPVTELKIIDPACGSGNFLLYTFDLLYDLYMDQIANYGADYEAGDIPRLIITHNLYGIDLDDRAVQLAQLGLYIKARRKRSALKIEHFNIVSSDFFLPEYSVVKPVFEDGEIGSRERKIIESLWADLQNAHKFGSLIRLEEKLSIKWFGVKQENFLYQFTLFDEQELEDYNVFHTKFFDSLHKAVAGNKAKQGLTFLNTKTEDAVRFLQLLTQKYDIAVANPPYTDSADFGPELKRFLDANYRQPHKFNTNLYAAFILRCCELTLDTGYVGLIHPHTFMFIKSFEDVRKYIIEQTHICLLVDYGLDRVNLFGPGILLDATWYVLGKKKRNDAGIYFNITANQQEKLKQSSLNQAYTDFIENRPNDRLYTLSQEKLKIIEGWPFIYWISDGFREKFKEKALDEVAEIKVGINSGSNEHFVRFWWEINNDIGGSKNNNDWVGYVKGGPFNKWFGNLWLKINWANNGNSIRNYGKAILRNEEFFFKEGITYSASGSKGVSFRYLPSDFIFDVGGSCVFPKINSNKYSFLALLNSSLSLYLIDCLNPTVNTQVGDLKRVPYVHPVPGLNHVISELSKQNIEIKKKICSYSITEMNFSKSPLVAFSGTTLQERLLVYLDFENASLTQVFLNEAIINEYVFEIYELSKGDREQVEAKMGKSIGALPVIQAAKDAFLQLLAASPSKLADVSRQPDDEFRQPLATSPSKLADLSRQPDDVFGQPLPDIYQIVEEHIRQLEVVEFDEQQQRAIIEGFAGLYQANNDLEEFCVRHQINPVNVWYWFRNANVLPQARAAELAMEFLTDAIRSLLQQDADGIIPLTGLPGEEALNQRLERYCLENGFSSAQFVQLDSLLGRPLDDYLAQHFFRDLSDRLNLFMYLPKTPFIWHLSSGEHQGIEVFILIYKWNRDSLYKLKSQYVSYRRQSLEYRLMQLHEVSTALSQAEKEKIRCQLEEIELFTTKVDALIAEGYDPILDDGVGKNIAPLQKKGLLKSDVLSAPQLTKYLNANW